MCDYQMININDEQAFCKHCNSNISDIINFTYANKTIAEPRYWEEYCICKNCKNIFIMRYDIFDPDGHIYSRVFSEDINDTNYHWQDHLTDGQKGVVAEHLKSCNECRDRLSQEILADAWLKAFMENLRNDLKKE